MLTEEQGNTILTYARDVLEKHVRKKAIPEAPECEFLKEKRGVFVTIKQNNELRGCIGFPLPKLSLDNAVKRATISATKDSRFPPIKDDDLDSLSLVVTILSQPSKIELEEPDNYFDEIEIGKHGLIIECENRSGLLLPQVPLEQNWSLKEYLQNLCAKAMLPLNAWKRENTTIYKFEGQLFSEA